MDNIQEDIGTYKIRISGGEVKLVAMKDSNFEALMKDNLSLDRVFIPVMNMIPVNVGMVKYPFCKPKIVEMKKKNRFLLRYSREYYLEEAYTHIQSAAIQEISVLPITEIYVDKEDMFEAITEKWIDHAPKWADPGFIPVSAV